MVLCNAWHGNLFVELQKCLMNDCGDSSSCSSIVPVHSRVFGKRLSSRNKVEYFRSNISISVNIQSRDYLEGTDVIRLCLLEAS